MTPADRYGGEGEEMRSEREELCRVAEACWHGLRTEIVEIERWRPVYLKPLWTVRDVMFHCAFRVGAATDAIYAHIENGACSTGTAALGETLDAMNQRVVEASQSLTARDVDDHWVVTLNGFLEALWSLDDAAMLRFIACPRGERRPVVEMVWDELLHVQQHVDDIFEAVGAEQRAP